MIRAPDWEERLGDYLASRDGAVFAYGKIDCALFVAGAVKAMTGKDPARGFRGKYRSQASAVRAITQAGFESLSALMDAKFNNVPVAFAQRGDIVMDQDGSLGIVFGRDAIFVGQSDDTPGLVRQPLASWARAWRVPFE